MTCSMCCTYSSSRNVPGARYRYYVCANAQKRGWATCPTKSVQASVIEEFVIEQVRERANAEGGPAKFDRKWDTTTALERPALLRQMITSVSYDSPGQRIRIAFVAPPIPPAPAETRTKTRARPVRTRRKTARPQSQMVTNGASS